MTAFTVRRYRRDDTRELMALFHQTVHTVNARDYTPEQLRAWVPDTPDRMDEAAWAARLGGKHTLVAEAEDGILIGFANLEQMDGVAGAGHIDQFFGHRDYQGVGVGRALLTGIEREARARGMGRLFVEASVTARPFFERNGFRVLAEQTVERAGVGLTNFRMEKTLADDAGVNP
jgi:putative acetyltransferase